MNSAVLIGRLVKDPELRYTASQHAVCKFTIAIDRVGKKGEEKKTDYPRIIVFDTQAENCERYLAKGRLVGVQGRIQTGSYQDKNGNMVYTTDVVADRVEFLEWGNTQQETHAEAKAEPQEEPETAPTTEPETAPSGFEQIDEDIPF
jgi:single-strand DNA-binding protein